MRLPRLRQGCQEARHTFSEAFRLMRGSLTATLLLGLLLGVVPAMLRCILFTRAQGMLLSVWEGWLHALTAGTRVPETLSSLVYATMQQTGLSTLGGTALDLFISLLITPLLLSSLALLYNGFILRDSDRVAFDAMGAAWRNKGNLILVAVALMVAEWAVHMVPSIASGLLSLVSQLLSWIPVLGLVIGVLAMVLSIALSLLTDFAVTVIFCYVWICASCEGVSGFGSLVRSWQLTRNAMPATIFSLIGLILFKWAAMLALGLLWLLAGRALGIPLTALLYCFYAVEGVYLTVLGAATSALYLRRPASGSGPDLHNMKRANM